MNAHPVGEAEKQFFIPFFRRGYAVTEFAYGDHCFYILSKKARGTS
jgi:predicted GNAT superfamily acetyltransferase